MVVEFLVWLYGLIIFVHMMYIMWKRHRIEFERTWKSMALIALIILFSFIIIVFRLVKFIDYFSINIIDYENQEEYSPAMQ